jgi:methionyl-tRNA formyltransferase
MRIVFLGSGAFAIPPLEALLDAGHEVAAVVTQPDREKGRGREVAPPPVKPVALRRGLEVRQPRRIREPAALDDLRRLRPEILVVVAYGQILPKAVLEVGPRGAVNVHASLLPLYRGAAPIQWAIVRGEAETGVTTMLLDEGLDTGPILLSRSTPIGSEETAGSLQERLALLGAPLLVETLDRLESGSLVPTPQDPSRASLAPLIRKEDGRIDWSHAALDVARRVRGFDPWPGAWSLLEGRSVKILAAAPASGGHDPRAEPGAVIGLRADAVTVACGGGTALDIRRLQPESRRAMDAAAFAAGARLRAGEARFG